jgi:hypothetical protein
MPCHASKIQKNPITTDWRTSIITQSRKEEKQYIEILKGNEYFMVRNDKIKIIPYYWGINRSNQIRMLSVTLYNL